MADGKGDKQSGSAQGAAGSKPTRRVRSKGDAARVRAADAERRAAAAQDKARRAPAGGGGMKGLSARLLSAPEARSHSVMAERLIAGVPARIMRPRLIFLSCLAAVVLFGLLMVYSASAVEALKEQGSATYFLFRQAVFCAIGLALFVFVSSRFLPSRLLDTNAVWGPWLVVLALLLVVRFAGLGGEEWGASRWIQIGPFSLQPSEFAKPAVIAVAAKLFSDYYETRSIDTPTFLVQLGACLLLTGALIFTQPDLGTTIIIVMTVFAMAYLAGMKPKLAVGILAVAVVVFGLFMITSPYRLARFQVFMDPWSDPYGDGYQATLAIMAFASGGFFGRGIGASTMKYHYLPEAHNDYILAIIGEELGFVGTAVFIAVFLLMIWAAFTISRRSPSLHGQLLAGGCAVVLILQFFVNALGILGVMPMTGKPLPFISYGGSSMLSSFILAGLILRVSRESGAVAATEMHRPDLSVVGGEGDAVSAHMGRSTAAAPTRRSARPSAPGRRDRAESGSFTVVDSRSGYASRERPSSSAGFRRIDLNGDGGDLLRRRDRDARPDRRSAPRDRRDGRARGSRVRSVRKDSYDR